MKSHSKHQLATACGIEPLTNLAGFRQNSLMQGITKAFSILLILFFIAISPSAAQSFHLTGRVIDFETRYALAFVSIQINNGPEGGISDIDGKFTVKSGYPIQKLKISYIGYEPMEYLPENSGNDIVIRMKKTAYELAEVVIKPGINPADRIIRAVIANRFINDHEHLPSFSYTSYEKTVFGPESDSIPPIDSLQTDSTFIKASRFFKKKHLFLMESVVKRNFKFPSENYNKVIASRVSGFSDPLFVFLMSQMQSTTFYTDVIRIVGKDYINPISNGCFSKYYFEIQDTLIESYPYDTTYLITFRPLLKTHFDGLKGSVSISTHGYAIRNVIAIPAVDQGMFSVKIQQMYDFIDSTHWFPVQLNTDLIFKNSEIAIDSTKNAKLKMTGRGKSYISDINLDPKLRRDQFGVYEVDVLPDAYRQPEETWNRYRLDSLTTRDRSTYRFMDSLGKVKNFDKLGRKLNSMMSGAVSLGYFDLYPDNLFRVNHYEGFRTGLKLSTSDRVSSWFKLGGYAAYGFKDKKYKYGVDGSLTFDRFRNFRLKTAFYDDIDEAGADDVLAQERSLLNPTSFREILVERMDHTRCYKLAISSRVFKYLTLGAGVAVYKRNPLYTYSYIRAANENIRLTSSDFSFSEVSLFMSYAFGEKFIRNNNAAISLGTRYPIIQFYAGHGFNGFLNGQYSFNRFDIKINKSIFTPFVGTTSITIEAGLIDRDIPYVNLYNARASYKPFTLYSPGSFATMRMNEFTSDRYASLFISHNFGTLLFRSRYFNPEPELVTNFGIGSLSHPENHEGQTLRSFNKGYCESGIAINKAIRFGLTDIGFAWLYRYGAYALPSFKDNSAWKIAFDFMF